MLSSNITVLLIQFGGCTVLCGQVVKKWLWSWMEWAKIAEVDGLNSEVQQTEE